jgi:hypothetical protein
MTETYTPPIAPPLKIVPGGRALVGPEPAILEKRIGRMPLKSIVSSYAQLKVASLINTLSRRAVDAPATTILVGAGAGLIAGVLIRLTFRSRMTNRRNQR